MATKNTRLFSDLDLSMAMHPSTKDITVKYDANAIKNSVKNLILTRHFERHFHSEIGSNAYNMLFELVGPVAETLLRQEIIDVINNFEPRVNVLKVDTAFQADNNTMFVNIVFAIKNTTTPITVEFTLNRTR